MGADQPYDPKLRELMAKIQALMSEYDVGGTVTLSSRTHHEFADVRPSWCTLKCTELADGKLRVDVRLNAKCDPSGANASLGHVLGTRDILKALKERYYQFAAVVEKTLQQEGIPYQHAKPPGYYGRRRQLKKEDN